MMIRCINTSLLRSCLAMACVGLMFACGTSPDDTERTVPVVPDPVTEISDPSGATDGEGDDQAAGGGGSSDGGKTSFVGEGTANDIKFLSGFRCVNMGDGHSGMDNPFFEGEARQYIEYRFTLFDQRGCQGNILMEDYWQGTWGHAGPHQVDLSFVQTTRRFPDEALRARANAESFCGVSDYGEIGFSDVTSETCSITIEDVTLHTVFPLGNTLKLTFDWDAENSEFFMSRLSAISTVGQELPVDERDAQMENHLYKLNQAEMEAQ